MNVIHSLRKKISGEEFDYQVLMECLKDFARPRDKISALLRDKSIVRVKKGLYVFGPTYARRPFSKETLANLIYGPSYISLDYALHFYGFIPESVETITCVTRARARSFSTPVGRFTYHPVPRAAYPIGVDRKEREEGRFVLMAMPEKAWADKLHADRGTAIRNQAEMRDYLVKHLRVELNALKDLDPVLLSRIAKAYRSRKIRFLCAIVRRLARTQKKS
jgi:hypothetical protein